MQRCVTCLMSGMCEHEEPGGGCPKVAIVPEGPPGPAESYRVATPKIPLGSAPWRHGRAFGEGPEEAH